MPCENKNKCGVQMVGNIRSGLLGLEITLINLVVLFLKWMILKISRILCKNDAPKILNFMSET